MNPARVGANRAGGWSDPAFRAFAMQALVLLLTGGVVGILGLSLVHNLDERSIRTGFGFLWQMASFEIDQSFIPYSADATFGTAFLVGLLNTLVVAVFGIILATVAGVIVGVASLSRNPLVAPLARTYVEVVRNVPLLLQLYLCYAVMTQMLPMATDAPQLLPGVYLAKSGLHFPLLSTGTALVFAALVGGALAAAAYAQWSRRRLEITGHAAASWPRAALMIGPAILTLFYATTAAPLDMPQPNRFGFSGGGAISPELLALLIGLALYNTAFIAEIVRAGILSVSASQWEAAAALGLGRGRTLRLVILPQALKVLVPPLASQYLNLAKNTSLAIAIGYPDLMSIGNTIINQTGQAVEVIALLMAVYLSMSLSISAFMNWYNARVALVGSHERA